MADGKQIPHHGEAIVLRTWPFHEADLLVSLLTRDQGKVKGIARHALRSRKRFGGALEPATHVRAHYTERPRQDLVRLDSFEIVWSPLTISPDYLQLAGLQLVVEALEEVLPDLAADDNIFRLALATLHAMGSGAVWLPITYFCMWMIRLMGWLPALGHCAACGLDLRAQTVWWSPAADGITCSEDRRSGSKALSASSIDLSHRIARVPIADLIAAEEWPRERAADLRSFAIGMIERHMDRRLRSAVVLQQQHA